MKHAGSKKTSPSRPAAGRRPGSRADAAGSRHQLLVAARAEFAKHGFRGTTIRHVADRAGVTPAMVHYHFGAKQGLYHAVLEETFAPVLENLQALAARDAPGSIRDAFAGYMRMLARTPELPALLMRDVLSEDGPMRDAFIRDFAARGADTMRQLLEHDRKAGRLRKDLDPRLALLSLMSLAVFPFIARPIATRVLGLAYDDAAIEELATHSARLFFEGAAVRGDSP